MKHKIYVFVCFIGCLILASCSTMKLKDGRKNTTQMGQIEEVTMIAQNENIQHHSRKIGHFILKEDFNIEWKNLRKKMTDFANENGGNLFEISEIGFGKKGHVFYVEGELYYNENLGEIRSQFNENCAIHIIRPSFGNPLGSTFTINIEIDGDKYEKVSHKQKPIKKEFSDCDKEVEIFTNKSRNVVKLNGTPKYYFVAREGGMMATAGGVGISVGEVTLTEIEDKDFGRVMMYQY